MNTSEVLDKAADEIERRGWARGAGWMHESSTADDQVCMEGAIMAALGLRLPDDEHDDEPLRPLYTCPAYRAVSDYLNREPAGIKPDGFGFTGEPLYWWNDEVASSASVVIEVLRAAAMVERTREAAAVAEAVSA